MKKIKIGNKMKEIILVNEFQNLTFDKDAPFGRCPACGYEFNSELLNEYKIRHCLSCGQAINTTETI